MNDKEKKPNEGNNSGSGKRLVRKSANTGGSSEQPPATPATGIESPSGTATDPNSNGNNTVSGNDAGTSGVTVAINDGGRNESDVATEPPRNIGDGIGSGNSNDSGIPNTAGRTPGQRGRHKRDCSCGKCTTKREAKIGVKEIPFRVDGNETKPRDVKGNILEFPTTVGALGEQLKKSISLVWEGIYQMPVLMGYGEHWSLQPDEAKLLTDNTVNLVDNVPNQYRKQIMDAMKTWMPVSSFLVAVGMVTYPRYVATKMMIYGNATKGGENDRTQSAQPSVEHTNNGVNGTPIREHPFANLYRP